MKWIITTIIKGQIGYLIYKDNRWKWVNKNKAFEYAYLNGCPYQFLFDTKFEAMTLLRELKISQTCMMRIIDIENGVVDWMQKKFDESLEKEKRNG